MKSILRITLVLALILSLFPMSASLAKTESYNIHLEMNTSVDALNWLNSNPIQVGNMKYFKEKISDKKTKGNLDLRFSIHPSPTKGFELIQGQGVVRVGNFIAPITLEDEIERITVSTGKIIYNGPVEATLKLGGKDQDALIGLTFDPSSQYAFASLTVGSISDDGNAFIFFGNPLPEQAEIKQYMYDKMNVERNPLTVNSLQQNSTNFATTQSVNGNYPYKNFSDNYYLRWQSNSSSSQTPYSVAGLNVYARDPILNGNGSGSVQARAWSNTKGVVNYVNSLPDAGAWGTTASVYEANISFFTSNGSAFINITNAGPVDSKPISAWDWISDIPNVGTGLQMIANGIVAAYNANAPITSTKTVDAATGRVKYLRKTIRYLGTSSDFPNAGDNSYAQRSHKDGGIQAFFDYSEFIGGSQNLTCGARIDYLVDNHSLYFGYFYSDAAIAAWAADMAQ